MAAKQVMGQIVGMSTANADEIPSNVQPAQAATSYATPSQNQMVQAQLNPMAQAAQTNPMAQAAQTNPMAQTAQQGQMAQSDTGANAGICPHCNKRAGKGKFCIECGKSVALAPAQSNPMPQPAQAVQAAMPSQAAQSARAGAPQPRYGGLEVQNRDAMPSKRPSMIPNASQVAQMAQRAQHQASADDQGFGPLSQRVAKDMASANAEPTQAQAPVITNHRQPVTSLTPDVSRLGLKPQTGVEF